MTSEGLCPSISPRSLIGESDGCGACRGRASPFESECGAGCGQPRNDHCVSVSEERVNMEGRVLASAQAKMVRDGDAKAGYNRGGKRWACSADERVGYIRHMSGWSSGKTPGETE